AVPAFHACAHFCWVFRHRENCCWRNHSWQEVYSASSKRLLINATTASCAGRSSAPSNSRSSSVPWLAASIITAMMFLASIMRLAIPARIWQRNGAVVDTSFAAARACSPSLLMTVILVEIINACRRQRVRTRQSLCKNSAYCDNASRKSQAWLNSQLAVSHLNIPELTAEGLGQTLGHIY